MKKIFCSLLMTIIVMASVLAQTVTLTFTAQDAGSHYVQLDRVVISNLTKNWQETICWPDTVLVMQNGVGVVNFTEEVGFSLSQNNPNPFSASTEVCLTVVEDGSVRLQIADANGRMVEARNLADLRPGTHQFRISLATAGTYVVSASQNGKTSSIKMVCNGGGGTSTMEYLGEKNAITYVLKSNTTNPFDFGDMMEYVGYATINGMEAESEYITQAQDSSQAFVMQFAENQVSFQDGQPCPGVSTVTDWDGNTYNTVQIGNQCWMKENLRTTHYADGTEIPLGTVGSSSTARRYYPNNTSSNVSTYGYLYNWKAVMRNSTSSNANPSGIQGICPNGWHVPSDAEWTQLTVYVSSQSQYVCGNDSSYIAKALADTTGWISETNSCAVGNNQSANNAAGFSARPAGFYNNSDGGHYNAYGYGAHFWSSTEYDGSKAYYFDVCSSCPFVNIWRYPNSYGFSVRCLRDVGSTSEILVVSTLGVTSITATTAVADGNVADDGGSTVTARGVCWSTSQNPTVSDNHTTDGTGVGTFTSNITGLTPNTTYYVRAYATNSVGTAYGNDVSFTTSSTGAPQDGQPCPGAPMIVDYDNNIYNTVQIGNQCWMKENLRTTHYANGTEIPLGTDVSYITAYRYCSNDQSFNVFTYGYLYNWIAVMQNSTSSDTNPSGVQGICPTGWHVPSDAEWTQLINYVRSRNQYVCGSDNTYIAWALAATTEWRSSDSSCAVGYNQSINNATGFSALPAGLYFDGSMNFGEDASFWSSTKNRGSFAMILSCSSPSVVNGNIYEPVGCSVRCLRDAGITSDTFVVSTLWVTSITATTAVTGGNVISDGGAAVTSRGLCWSISQNPTVSDSHTNDGTGMGTFTSNIMDLTPNTTYYVRAYATNSIGTAYGNEVCFTTSDIIPQYVQPCPGAATILDFDSNIYNTVQIGNQCWMKENLRTTHYADGTSIVLGTSSSDSIAYRYDYTSSNIPLEQRGYLYNWTAVMRNSFSSNMNPSGVQGICPNGWHVPSDAEWTQLTDYVGRQSQYVCGIYSSYIAKALADTTGWDTHTSTCAVGNIRSANNATGFSALPAGYILSSSCNGSGLDAFFWSSTESSSSRACYRNLNYNRAGVSSYSYSKKGGFSVRCLRNGSTSATVSTLGVTSITDTTAVVGGNVTDDGGSAVTARGVCWSTSQNPTISDSHTTDGTGMGMFTSNITGLLPNTTYYMRAYATNSIGTAYGNEVSFTTSSTDVPQDSHPCPGVVTVTDWDGNTYNSVQIGNQCWMKENLRTTHYADGTEIPLGTSASSTTAYRYYPANTSSYVPTYGYLYNWTAVMRNSFSSNMNPSGVQGICPNGWHVPSDAEWTQLTDYVSRQSQYVCGIYSSYIAKALADTTGWNTYSGTCAVGNTPSSNNATGFSALPAGYFDYSSYFGFANYASFWSSTEYSSSYAYSRDLDYDYAGVYSFVDDTYFGFSVRCLRD